MRRVTLSHVPWEGLRLGPKAAPTGPSLNCGEEEGGAALLNTSLVTGSPADWKCGLEPQVLLLKDVTVTLGGALGRLEEDPGGKACLCERDKYRDLDGKSSPLSGPQRPTQDPHGPPPKRVITRLKTGLVTCLSA